MRNFDDNEFVNSIKNKNWDMVLNYDDVNDAFDVWKQLFNNVCDTHAPIKLKREACKRIITSWMD